MSPVETFKRLAPPVLFDLVKARLGTRFDGHYSSWAEAKHDCSGYDSSEILKRVQEATRAVVSGRAASERDGIQLNRVEYSWPMLASLLWVSNQSNSRLSVVDFGGSLGSSYRQNARFLSELESVKWGVVEQASFVVAGKAEFETDALKFFETLDEAFHAIRPNVLLLSSVLQYVEHPYAMLDYMLKLAPPFIVIDRTPVIDGPTDRLTVQTVSKRVYPGSYPAWFFSRSKFFRHFEGEYDLVETFDTADRVNIPSHFLGAVFKRRA